METSDILLVASIVFAGGAGFFLLKAPVARLTKRKRSFAADLSGKRGERLLSWGVGCLRPAAVWLLRWPLVRDFAVEAAALLKERGFLRVQPRGLVSLGLCVCAVSLLVDALLLGSVFSALAVVMGAVALIVFLVRSEADKQAEQVRMRVPDSIQAMKSCFQAGFSLEQTLEYQSQHGCKQLADAYRHALQALRLGCTASEALDGLRQEVNAPEFAFVMVALEVQHRTGGSLAAVLADAEQMARSHFELERSLRVQTAQARLSARVVSAMPLVLVGLFSLVTEGFLDPFFSSVPGVLMFCLAVIMQVAGVLMVRKTLDEAGVRCS